AAARGAMLIALAVVIGLLLLAFALDDPDTEVTAGSGDDTAQGDDSGDDTGDSAGDDTSGDDTVVTTSSTTTTPASTITAVPTNEPRPPAEVSVLVANGTGEKGVAGAVSDKINARGYIALDAANAAAPTTESVIFYRDGFDGNAVAIAEIIGTTADLVLPEPADGTIGVAQNAIDDGRLAQAGVVVILGSDGRIPLGVPAG
ncbi:MAG: LytR C-terminal domain-containing protein, partial [Acidimicrobiales bacterium]|nr:LytR C-terminal domain-containing protein [Acidimicrobiales bacterium]